MNKLSSTNQVAIKLPIYLSVIYLVATLVIYVLCPYDWPTSQPVLFYGLNILYIAALCCGYYIGQKREFRFSWIEWTEEKTDRLAGLISVMIIINCVMYLIYIFRCYGFKEPNFPSLWEQMLIGLKRPGLGYYFYYERQKVLDGPDVLGGTLYTVISLLWGFFKHSVTIFSVMYFKRLKLYGKIFTVAYFAMVLVFYMSIGTNIQVLHIFLMVELPVILEFFEQWYRKELTGRKVIRLLSFVLAGLMVVALYFGWMLESRSQEYGYDISEYAIGGIKPGESETPPVENPPVENPPVEQPPVENPPVEQPPVEQPPVEQPPVETPPVEEPMSPLMQKINNFWLSFSSYLTQGYYGMSQALELEWTPMFGLGNSMFVVDMITGNITDIKQYTYQAKLEPLGWDSKVRWHSIYTWIANDVSFYGVPVVMLLLGGIFGMMFKDAIVTRNPFARASVFFYILLLLFIPCNNQIAQSNENLCAFLLLIGMWLICGRGAPKAANED